MLIIILFSGVMMGAQAQRQVEQFDRDWKFHFGHAAAPAKDFNYGIANIYSKTGKAADTAIDPKFQDDGWQPVQLPHDWAVALPFAHVDNADVMAHGYKPVGGLFPETSVGWYRKHFTVAAADSGQRFALRFDGIFRDSRVWVNGFFVGHHESGYTSVTYDVTDYLRFDQDNVVVVRVDATQYEGWFYEGAGIYRHVWWEQYQPVHIATAGGVFVHSKVTDQQATVTIETTVENESLQPATGYVLEAYVASREGKLIATAPPQPFTLGVNAGQTLRQEVVVNNPTLWSLENPYRYRVVTTVKRQQQMVDQVTTRLGIRTIAIAPTLALTLNGEVVKVQGVNCHQDHAGVGSALPDYLQYYRIRLLKEMGVNAYRTSHNPPTPELLDACDSLGMLVMDETRLLNSSPQYLGQLEAMILRDRNHPSVFMWSIGNEEGYAQRNSIGKRIALTMLAKQQELDPTRTSTYAADLANVYPGVNEVIPVRGFNYRVNGVDPYHHDHPTQPIVGTEMGSTVTTRSIYVKDSLRGYVPDQDITHPWWANRAEDWWTVAATRPWWMGGFIWTGFDYRGEPTPYTWPNVNSHFGVMDVCGFPKNIYYYYQSWWVQEDVLHISPHWNWAGQEGEAIDVWVNSNADEVELFLNGKSQGRKPMPRNQHLQWAVPYQAGTLKAVGYQGKRKFTTSVTTTSAAYKVVLIPDKTTLTADGADATVVNVAIQDKKGRLVPTAGNLVHFTVKGPAHIIGVGNGDPSCHEADQCADGQWQRSAFGGWCQLILQAGEAGGSVTVEAIADELQAGSATLKVTGGR